MPTIFWMEKLKGRKTPKRYKLSVPKEFINDEIREIKKRKGYHIGVI